MKKFLLFVFVLSTFSVYSQDVQLPADTKIPSPEIQITTALLAAPNSYKEDATVLGYDKDGKLVTLRKGSNELICLADDPSEEDIHVACYSDKLADFMQRGRELAAE